MPSKTRIIGSVVALSLVTQLTACGTLFFPDRRGQIEGKIDPVVAGLNAVGILFYVIPGLIAFGIDFATGAIYLPNNQYSLAPEKLQDAIGADGRVDNLKLKAILQRELGRDLPLDDPRLIQHSGKIEQLAAYGQLAVDDADDEEEARLEQRVAEQQSDAGEGGIGTSSFSPTPSRVGNDSVSS